MVRIVLVDDHPIVRQGMRSLLEAESGWEIVGEASDGLSAIEVIAKTEPDIAVIDVMMPNLNGLEVIRRVTRLTRRTRIVVLSMHADEPYVVQAFQHGAMAYVLKATSTTSLVTAIRNILSGRRYLSPPLSEQGIEDYLQRVSDANQPVDRYELLTRREREVLHLVVQGETSNRIAERLSISPRTVESHRANLMRKLRFTTTSELYHFAHQRGIVSVK
jgi:two-component system, NarL family, response regulator NreC